MRHLKSLEFGDACLLQLFFLTGKSWNFDGLICLLFAGRGFKNWSTGMAGTSPSATLKKKERCCCLHQSCRVGKSSLWSILVMQPSSWSGSCPQPGLVPWRCCHPQPRLVPWSGSHPQQSMVPWSGSHPQQSMVLWSGSHPQQSLAPWSGSHPEQSM